MLEKNQRNKQTNISYFLGNLKMLSVAKYGMQHVSRADDQNPQ